MIQQILHFLFTGPGTDCVLAIPPLLIAALIGAASGALSNKEKQAEADRQRKYEAETARWSPWTGMKSKYVSNPNMTADVANGTASGLSFGAMNNGMFGGQNSPTTSQTGGNLSGQVSAWQPMANSGQQQGQPQNYLDKYRFQ